MNNKPLTHRQSQALDFIKSFVASKGYPPTIREIAEHMNYNSSSTAFNILEQLVRKGYIKKGTGPRELQIVGYEDVRDKEIGRLREALTRIAGCTGIGYEAAWRYAVEIAEGALRKGDKNELA